MDSKMNVTNEVLGAKLDAVGQRVEKVEMKVDNLNNSYVPHDIFELRLKELETQITAVQLSLKNLELELKKTNGRNALKTWVTGTVSAIFGSILTLLLMFYITNVNK